MPFPPKKLYTISELVTKRWKDLDTETVEDYLRTGRLQASILVPYTMMNKYTLQLHKNDYLGDNQYVYDLDPFDPDCYSYRQGIFNLFYIAVTWDDAGKATLERGGHYLSMIDDKEDCYYAFDEDFSLNRDDVFVTLSELVRFESEYDIKIDTAKSPNVKIVEATADNHEAMNPKRETTLLTVIAVLLEIISGDFPSKDIVRHPSIATQSDLIERLAELGTTGLSERNLQSIFAIAKANKRV